MTLVFQKIINSIVRKRFKKKNVQFDDKKLSREVEIFKVNIRHFVRDSIFVFVAFVSAGFGLKRFLFPNSFIDGGAMGI
jgi:hypothetical protein